MTTQKRPVSSRQPGINQMLAYMRQLLKQSSMRQYGGVGELDIGAEMQQFGEPPRSFPPIREDFPTTQSIDTQIMADWLDHIARGRAGLPSTRPTYRPRTTRRVVNPPMSKGSK